MPNGLSPDLMQEIIGLAREMGNKFAQSEFIPGCEVKDVSDKNQYDTDNGWIEAIVGQHNQQRCRWKGQYPNVSVGDFVDVLYFPTRRLFEVWRQGGSGSLVTSNTLNNFTATTDPGTGDDENDGYSDGSVWLNTSTDTVFRCADASAGAAVWRELIDANSDATFDAGVTVSTDNLDSVSSGGIAVADDLELADGKDIFPDGQQFGLWNRNVNYGVSPDERWTNNSDDISWAGWASYTGFGTPSIISTTNNIYRVANAGATKAFRYRAASTGAHIFLRCRVSITYVVSAGLMIDDGVDAGDGNGANNFYRAYITQSTLAGPVNLVEQYRTGGGSVTTNTSTGTVALGTFIGLRINTDGTRWTSWSLRPNYFGEAGEAVQFTSGVGAQTWTPARVGLYWVGTAVDGNRKGLWDWYDEATS